MSTPTFYDENLSDATDLVQLSDVEAHHLRASRRLNLGGQVRLLNGAGGVAEAQIQELDRRKCILKVSGFTQSEQPSKVLAIACAIPKPERQRFLIESLTQLGVTHILPLDCQRSITRNSHKSVLKWPRYAVEAIKQSGNPWLPQILSDCSLTDLADGELADDCKTRIFADGAANKTFKALAGDSCLAVIGPEGGLTDEELELLSEAGFVGGNLGEHILRTETAAIAIASVLAL